jgi:TM2 domain-containing membrane protein YozV
MERTTDASDERSFETDGGDDSATDSWDSTIEVDVTDDQPRGVPNEQFDDTTKQPLGTDEVYCWSCGVPIKSAAEICPQCGVRQQPPPTANQEKNPGIAALASAVWTGAGQIYNGEIGKGIGLMALMFVSALSIFLVIGLVTTPLIWIYSVYDAYRTAERNNQQPTQSAHEF